MKKLINKSFTLLKSNLIFIQPILIYLLIILIGLQYMNIKIMKIYPNIMMGASLFLFSIATISGLFYINKKALSDYNDQDTKIEAAQKSIKNFKKFFYGIGKYFIKILSGTIILFLISATIAYFSITYLQHKIDIIPILQFIEKTNNAQNINEINNLIHSLSKEDIRAINIWSLFLILSYTILNFIGILYFSIIVSDKKNAILSFIKTLIFFFKNIIPSAFIMIFMSAIYLLVNFTVIIFGMNSFAFGLFLLLIAIYSNFYIILVLCFYNEKNKINSNNGTKCNGQEQSCN